LEDLVVLGQHYHVVGDETRAEFEIPAPGGGKWLGSVMVGDGSRPLLVARTFNQ
jgi:hypothetical protein